MRIDYTFADGVTLPLKFVLSHYESPMYKHVQLTAEIAEEGTEKPTDVPVNTVELPGIGELFKAMFDFLEDAPSEQFLIFGKAGVARWYPHDKEPEEVDG